MESAFTYNGSIKRLNAALGTFGQGLTEAYMDILGRHAPHFFTAVRNTLPPYAYLENIRMHPVSEGTERKAERGVSQLEEELLFTYLSLSMINEAFAIELSRRVFSRLGLTLNTDLNKDELPTPLQRNLETLVKANDYGLIEHFIDWQSKLKGHPFGENFFDSLYRIRVNKIKPREEHIALAEDGPRTHLGSEEDNAFAVGSDYNPVQASLSKDGRLIYQRRITTYPMFVFSEAAIEHQQEIFKLEHDPATLYSFAHEMNHFLLYALQRFPMQLAQQIIWHHLFIDQQKPQSMR